jgi:hypothetical protein
MSQPPERITRYWTPRYLDTTFSASSPDDEVVHYVREDMYDQVKKELAEARVQLAAATTELAEMKRDAEVLARG